MNSMHATIAVFVTEEEKHRVDEAFILEKLKPYAETGYGYDDYLISIGNAIIKQEKYTDGSREDYLHNPYGFWDWFVIGGRAEDNYQKVKYKKIGTIREELKQYIYGFITEDTYYLRDYFVEVPNGSRLVSDKKFEGYLDNFIDANPDLYVVLVDTHS